MTVDEAIRALIEAGVKPEEFLKAYHAANPPAQPADASKLTVRLYSYGETEPEYDRAEWGQAITDDLLDHLIDHDASDLDTDTLIVCRSGAIVNPY